MIIPPHADVANAIGAVAGGVVLQRRILIQPVGTNEHVRLHLPDGVHDFSSLEECVAHARQVMSAELEALAREAGADHIEVRMARQDQEASVQGGWGDKIYLGTELTFTAVGRPRHARLARYPSDGATPMTRQGNV
jgi:N-methylhydantoinase A/oxoprolinase/acetone carboxylase beta subunit